MAVMEEMRMAVMELTRPLLIGPYGVNYQFESAALTARLRL